MHEYVDAYYDLFLKFTLYMHKNAATCAMYDFFFNIDYDVR